MYFSPSLVPLDGVWFIPMVERYEGASSRRRLSQRSMGRRQFALKEGLSPAPRIASVGSVPFTSATNVHGSVGLSAHPSRRAGSPTGDRSASQKSRRTKAHWRGRCARPLLEGVKLRRNSRDSGSGGPGAASRDAAQARKERAMRLASAELDLLWRRRVPQGGVAPREGLAHQSPEHMLQRARGAAVQSQRGSR